MEIGSGKDWDGPTRNWYSSKICKTFVALQYYPPSYFWGRPTQGPHKHPIKMCGKPFGKCEKYMSFCNNLRKDCHVRSTKYYVASKHKRSLFKAHLINFCTQCIVPVLSKQYGASRMLISQLKHESLWKMLHLSVFPCV